MSNQRRPVEIIKDFYEERTAWSDEKILSELVDMPGLPDEDEVSESGKDVWSGEILSRLYLYLALADHVGLRRLKPGVRLLLERASLGDFGETMRGLHHLCEAVYAGSDAELAELCLTLASHPRPGTKLWSMELLVRLKDERVIPYLVEALNGPIILRDYARSFLKQMHYSG